MKKLLGKLKKALSFPPLVYWKVSAGLSDGLCVAAWESLSRWEGEFSQVPAVPRN